MFRMFADLGWTMFTGENCRGGFVIAQCEDIADAIGQLITSDDAQCSSLGTRASKRFQAGGFHLRSNQQMMRYGERDGVGAYGHSFPPFRRSVLLNEVHWSGRLPMLPYTIVHEEAHIRYWGSHMINSRGKHDYGNQRDITFAISDRCAGTPWR